MSVYLGLFFGLLRRVIQSPIRGCKDAIRGSHCLKEEEKMGRVSL